ncbi:MAG: transcription termination/antitermination protein NusA [Ruminococcus sp.]|jgi:N utilization substance protein A|uniref:transcription termination factor NusA n=2 Tax=Ruminococcus sp. TaxID=41978 RepID=UPI0029302A46|nr:transcription termination factor NusA [uncultured Ruminococcus sp.]MBQ1586633.1 transcription termination/antitermination protein NusA [Ruminococcus sp.]MBQ1594144.1 transcription termination/antitermination protein NusA [Ruminococcus sp.]MBQ1717047.1 transcription termination/antitermination protein NusA [Ruminococcus sp.]MBQ1921533.1 transcription termination/antitermination protein NusA [Ruminococcus sp.]MBQ2212214.1 transcription termination/antitermination protein NusA [Ruminococcus sp
MTNKELFEALRMFEKEKDIPMDYMLMQIEKAITIACKNYFDGNEDVIFKADPEKNSFDVKLKKTVVDEVFDPSYEVSLEEAQKINKRKKFEIGDEIEVPLDPKKLGRIAISAARNVIRQGIRAGEKGQSLLEFQSKLGEIVTATVERIDPKSGIATIKIGKSEAMLPKSEQIGCENLKEGDHVKVYIADVKDNEKGPHAIISRSHPGFVRRLFEQEVPEIFDSIVEIKSVSREAGSRTKMAVTSSNPDVDAIGACIGQKGARVNRIVAELGGEKIDIIEYSDEPEKYISAALSPATVTKVEIVDEEKKSCKATVPDGQLSLAIGNKGQNARLAAKLTGWKIDIRPQSGFYGEDEDDEEPAAEEVTEAEAAETEEAVEIEEAVEE